MQREMDNLIAVLEEQRDIQAALVELSEKKVVAIASGDVETLNGITGQEQLCVTRIAAVERKQTACVEALAALLGMPAAQLRIQAVINAANGQTKERLVALRETLTALVDKQIKYNDMNRRLLEINMQHIQFMLNHAVQEPAVPTYGSTGDMQQPVRFPPRLLDRKV